MTREDQIKEALNLYAPSSWDFRGEIMPMSKDELQASHEGFVRGAKWADDNPKSSWIDVKDDLPCNHDELKKSVCCTDSVLVKYGIGIHKLAQMYKKGEEGWYWDGSYTNNITHWMPIPKLKED